MDAIYAVSEIIASWGLLFWSSSFIVEIISVYIVILGYQLSILSFLYTGKILFLVEQH